MTDSAPLVSDPFLAFVAPARRPVIAAEIEHIRANNVHTVIMAIENGVSLRRLKDLIERGNWLAWVVERSGYGSTKTAERHMKLAEYLGHQLETLRAQLEDGANLSALYKLVYASAPEEALQIAVTMMRQGTEVNGPKAAEIVSAIKTIHANAPGLMEHVTDERMTYAEAASVADACADVPDEVVLIVEKFGVRNVDVVRGLAVMQPEQLAEVAASGAVWNSAAELSVPVASASAADIQIAVNVQATEDFIQSIAPAQDWQAGSEPVARIYGTRDVLARDLRRLLKPGCEYRVIVYSVEARRERLL